MSSPVPPRGTSGGRHLGTEDTPLYGRKERRGRKKGDNDNHSHNHCGFKRDHCCPAPADFAKPEKGVSSSEGLLPSLPHHVPPRQKQQPHSRRQQLYKQQYRQHYQGHHSQGLRPPENREARPYPETCENLQRQNSQQSFTRETSSVGPCCADKTPTNAADNLVIAEDKLVRRSRRSVKETRQHLPVQAQGTSHKNLHTQTSPLPAVHPQGGLQAQAAHQVVDIDTLHRPDRAGDVDAVSSCDATTAPPLLSASDPTMSHPTAVLQQQQQVAAAAALYAQFVAAQYPQATAGRGENSLPQQHQSSPSGDEVGEPPNGASTKLHAINSHHHDPVHNCSLERLPQQHFQYQRSSAAAGNRNFQFSSVQVTATATEACKTSARSRTPIDCCARARNSGSYLPFLVLPPCGQGQSGAFARSAAPLVRQEQQACEEQLENCRYASGDVHSQRISNGSDVAAASAPTGATRVSVGGGVDADASSFNGGIVGSPSACSSAYAVSGGAPVGFNPHDVHHTREMSAHSRLDTAAAGAHGHQPQHQHTSSLTPPLDMPLYVNNGSPTSPYYYYPPALLSSPPVPGASGPPHPPLPFLYALNPATFPPPPPPRVNLPSHMLPATTLEAAGSRAVPAPSTTVTGPPGAVAVPPAVVAPPDGAATVEAPSFHGTVAVAAAASPSPCVSSHNGATRTPPGSADFPQDSPAAAPEEEHEGAVKEEGSTSSSVKAAVAAAPAPTVSGGPPGTPSRRKKCLTDTGGEAVGGEGETTQTHRWPEGRPSLDSRNTTNNKESADAPGAAEENTCAEGASGLLQQYTAGGENQSQPHLQLQMHAHEQLQQQLQQHQLHQQWQQHFYAMQYMLQQQFYGALTVDGSTPTMDGRPPYVPQALYPIYPLHPQLLQQPLLQPQSVPQSLLHPQQQQSQKALYPGTAGYHMYDYFGGAGGDEGAYIATSTLQHQQHQRQVYLQPPFPNPLAAAAGGGAGPLLPYMQQVNQQPMTNVSGAPPRLEIENTAAAAARYYYASVPPTFDGAPARPESSTAAVHQQRLFLPPLHADAGGGAAAVGLPARKLLSACDTPLDAAGGSTSSSDGVLGLEAPQQQTLVGAPQLPQQHDVHQQHTHLQSQQQQLKQHHIDSQQQHLQGESPPEQLQEVPEGQQQQPEVQLSQRRDGTGSLRWEGYASLHQQSKRAEDSSCHSPMPEEQQQHHLQSGSTANSGYAGSSVPNVCGIDSLDGDAVETQETEQEHSLVWNKTTQEIVTNSGQKQHPGDAGSRECSFVSENESERGDAAVDDLYNGSTGANDAQDLAISRSGSRQETNTKEEDEAAELEICKEQREETHAQAHENIGKEKQLCHYSQLTPSDRYAPAHVAEEEPTAAEETEAAADHNNCSVLESWETDLRGEKKHQQQQQCGQQQQQQQPQQRRQLKQEEQQPKPQQTDKQHRQRQQQQHGSEKRQQVYDQRHGSHHGKSTLQDQQEAQQQRQPHTEWQQQQHQAEGHQRRQMHWQSEDQQSQQQQQQWQQQQQHEQRHQHRGWEWTTCQQQQQQQLSHEQGKQQGHLQQDVFCERSFGSEREQQHEESNISNGEDKTRRQQHAQQQKQQHHGVPGVTLGAETAGQNRVSRRRMRRLSSGNGNSKFKEQPQPYVLRPHDVTVSAAAHTPKDSIVKRQLKEDEKMSYEVDNDAMAWSSSNNSQATTGDALLSGSIRSSGGRTHISPRRQQQKCQHQQHQRQLQQQQFQHRGSVSGRYQKGSNTGAKSDQQQQQQRQRQQQLESGYGAGGGIETGGGSTIATRYKQTSPCFAAAKSDGVLMQPSHAAAPNRGSSSSNSSSSNSNNDGYTVGISTQRSSNNNVPVFDGRNVSVLSQDCRGGHPRQQPSTVYIGMQTSSETFASVCPTPPSQRRIYERERGGEDRGGRRFANNNHNNIHDSCNDDTKTEIIRSDRGVDKNRTLWEDSRQQQQQQSSALLENPPENCTAATEQNENDIFNNSSSSNAGAAPVFSNRSSWSSSTSEKQGALSINPPSGGRGEKILKYEYMPTSRTAQQRQTQQQQRRGDDNSAGVAATLATPAAAALAGGGSKYNERGVRGNRNKGAEGYCAVGDESVAAASVHGEEGATHSTQRNFQNSRPGAGSWGVLGGGQQPQQQQQQRRQRGQQQQQRQQNAHQFPQQQKDRHLLRVQPQQENHPQRQQGVRRQEQQQQQQHRLHQQGQLPAARQQQQQQREGVEREYEKRGGVQSAKSSRATGALFYVEVVRGAARKDVDQEQDAAERLQHIDRERGISSSSSPYNEAEPFAESVEGATTKACVQQCAEEIHEVVSVENTLKEDIMKIRQPRVEMEEEDGRKMVLSEQAAAFEHSGDAPQKNWSDKCSGTSSLHVGSRNMWISRSSRNANGSTNRSAGGGGGSSRSRRTQENVFDITADVDDNGTSAAVHLGISDFHKQQQQRQHKHQQQQRWACSGDTSNCATGMSSSSLAEETIYYPWRRVEQQSGVGSEKTEKGGATALVQGSRKDIVDAEICQETRGGGEQETGATACVRSTSEAAAVGAGSETSALSQRCARECLPQQRQQPQQHQRMALYSENQQQQRVHEPQHRQPYQRQEEQHSQQQQQYTPHSSGFLNLGVSASGFAVEQQQQQLYCQRRTGREFSKDGAAGIAVGNAFSPTEKIGHTQFTSPLTHAQQQSPEKEKSRRVSAVIKEITSPTTARDEAKELALDKKLIEIRAKNRLLERRHKKIEAEEQAVRQGGDPLLLLLNSPSPESSSNSSSNRSSQSSCVNISTNKSSDINNSSSVNNSKVCSSSRSPGGVGGRHAGMLGEKDSAVRLQRNNSHCECGPSTAAGKLCTTHATPSTTHGTQGDGGGGEDKEDEVHQQRSETRPRIGETASNSCRMLQQSPRRGTIVDDDAHVFPAKQLCVSSALDPSSAVNCERADDGSRMHSYSSSNSSNCVSRSITTKGHDSPCRRRADRCISSTRVQDGNSNDNSSSCNSISEGAAGGSSRSSRKGRGGRRQGHSSSRTSRPLEKREDMSHNNAASSRSSSTRAESSSSSSNANSSSNSISAKAVSNSSSSLNNKSSRWTSPREHGSWELETNENRENGVGAPQCNIHAAAGGDRCAVSEGGDKTSSMCSTRRETCITTNPPQAMECTGRGFSSSAGGKGPVALAADALGAAAAALAAGALKAAARCSNRAAILASSNSSGTIYQPPASASPATRAGEDRQILETGALTPQQQKEKIHIPYDAQEKRQQEVREK